MDVETSQLNLCTTHQSTMESDAPFSAGKPAMEDSIEALLSMLRWCGSSQSFKQLQNMQHDKLATEEELKSLQVAYNANLTALAKKEAELHRFEDDLAAERESVARLTEELQRAEETVRSQEEEAQVKAGLIAEQERRIEELLAQIGQKDERAKG
ncbi:hypothetical protein CDD81_4838 [Ophiocordyceps australis]|uniref:Uncharacterized protein n=1 Tax=Ophiocordyceps australis TaxID=1399860 RepID=A0A2C5YB82_9HYPO|nr:hypothetical protein CDD81_4838 [Ophiocordyceps australis]